MRSIEQAELIVIQSSSLCNLNCYYCKLPDRRNKFTVTPKLVGKMFENLIADDLLKPVVTVCWHLGEPLTLPIEFYRDAHSCVKSAVSGKSGVRFAFQTNGTLITKNWCDFFLEEAAEVGLSIDGPSDIHDLHRPDWSGGGSHARTLRGLRYLQEANVRHYVISVLDKRSLNSPASFYRYFKGIGVTRLCLNVEESEGLSKSLFLQDNAAPELLRGFYSGLYQQVLRDANAIWIREIDGMQRAILVGDLQQTTSQETVLGRLLTILSNGDVIAYSPGFASLAPEDRTPFILGNVAYKPLSQTVNHKVLDRLSNEVNRAVTSCRQRCDFFTVCGGGSPGHRWAEYRDLSRHETATCKASVQALARGVVDNVFEAIQSQQGGQIEQR